MYERENVRNRKGIENDRKKRGKVGRASSPITGCSIRYHDYMYHALFALTIAPTILVLAAACT